MLASIFISGSMKFDHIKYLKRTLSPVGYAREMNFDPLRRIRLFELFSDHMFKMKFDPFSIVLFFGP